MADDRWLLALGLASVTSGIAGLLIPLYLVRIGAGGPALGIAAALGAVASVPAGIVVGRYTDRTGRRRRPLLAAIGGIALVVGTVPLLTAVPAVIVANAVLAFALAAIGPVATILIVAGATEAQWPERIARLNAIQGYGTTAGLVLGAVWTGVAVPLTSPPCRPALAVYRSRHHRTRGYLPGGPLVSV
ncbi:MAG: MFS transporter [Halobacteriaceae archaeon]